MESPIDIIAKPKGKRPLSINQLSGGEKTLTATALLFAIYLIKPAPFCIFDEVDAPLDDANIDKFNQIIREFSKDSQFIIVTQKWGLLCIAVFDLLVSFCPQKAFDVRVMQSFMVIVNVDDELIEYYTMILYL